MRARRSIWAGLAPAFFQVIRTDPAAGTSPPVGTRITIVVSKGQAPVAVPNVVGQSQSSATAELQSKGFSVTTSPQSSTTVKPGDVISTSPVPGTKVAPGSTVTIVVAQKPTTGTVPGVTGKPRDTAIATLFHPDGTPMSRDETPLRRAWRGEDVPGTRLRDEEVGTCENSCVDVLTFAMRGDHDDGHVAHGAHHGQDLDAVDVRQAEIEQDDVGPIVDHRLQAGKAGRLPVHRMPTLRERTAQRRTDPRVVLDEQDDSHRRDGTPSEPLAGNKDPQLDRTEQ